MQPLKRVEMQCIACKSWFPSPIQMGSMEALLSTFTAGNITNCPSCGRMVPCNKENMRVTRSDGKGGWVGDDTRG